MLFQATVEPEFASSSPEPFALDPPCLSEFPKRFQFQSSSAVLCAGISATGNTSLQDFSLSLFVGKKFQANVLHPNVLLANDFMISLPYCPSP